MSRNSNFVRGAKILWESRATTVHVSEQATSRIIPPRVIKSDNKQTPFVEYFLGEFGKLHIYLHGNELFQFLVEELRKANSFWREERSYSLPEAAETQAALKTLKAMNGHVFQASYRRRDRKENPYFVLHEIDSVQSTDKLLSVWQNAEIIKTSGNPWSAEWEGVQVFSTSSTNRIIAKIANEDSVSQYLLLDNEYHFTAEVTSGDIEKFLAQGHLPPEIERYVCVT